MCLKRTFVFLIVTNESLNLFIYDRYKDQYQRKNFNTLKKTKIIPTNVCLLRCLFENTP